MTLPAKLRIGAIDYTIAEEPDLKDADGEARYGIISYRHSTIQLDANQTARMKQITLWHETLHGLFMQAGMHDMGLEENIAVALSHALVELIRENPELIAYTIDD